MTALILGGLLALAGCIIFRRLETSPVIIRIGDWLTSKDIL